MKDSIRYLAQPTQVEEVSLLGSADLAFWTAFLEKENLKPLSRCERARILVMGARMTYMGLRFTEVSFSVLVSAPGQDDTKQAAFLLHAVNSSRLLAWGERVLLGTPYRHADCRVSMTLPVSVQVAAGGDYLFSAQMPASAAVLARRPTRSSDEGWEGAVFLPGCRRCSGVCGRLFFARMKGNTIAYPFLSEEDTISIRPPQEAPLLRLLLQSEFQGEQWLVRVNATHGQSETYRRSDI